ncbi:MAG: 4-(cytidine 5'-diphospho)-2-C-methyl-D-erythritol kinase, partial [Bacilli bacterium]|nr:4-(cytidine 5'-diphospho)-2-C-methyl-D-erythritol kinase [Bacilli bacterium]
GRGEIVRKLRPMPSCWVILAKPRLSVSTKTIFRLLAVEELQHKPTSRIVAQAIEEGDYERMCQNVGNALEQVTFNKHPELRQLKDRMEKYGLDGVTMSGSGPTIIGFSQNTSRIKRAYNSLRGFCEEVYMVRLLNEE